MLWPDWIFSNTLRCLKGIKGILLIYIYIYRKFNPGVDERSRLQLSYLGEELNSSKLAQLVTDYNNEYPYVFDTI